MVLSPLPLPKRETKIQFSQSPPEKNSGATPADNGLHILWPTNIVIDMCMLMLYIYFVCIFCILLSTSCSLDRWVHQMSMGSNARVQMIGLKWTSAVSSIFIFESTHYLDIFTDVIFKLFAIYSVYWIECMCWSMLVMAFTGN